MRVISRLADIYLMNNIFLALGQVQKDTRNQGVVDLLMMGQVESEPNEGVERDADSDDTADTSFSKRSARGL